MLSLAHFLLRCCHTFFTSALGLLPWTATLQEWCNSEKFWKFQILIKFKLIKYNIFRKKSEKIRKNLKISDFQKKWKNQKKLKISDFQKKMKNSEKIWKIQIFRKKSENFRKNKISEKIQNFQIKENLKISIRIWKSYFKKCTSEKMKNQKDI